MRSPAYSQDKHPTPIIEPSSRRARHACGGSFFSTKELDSVGGIVLHACSRHPRRSAWIETPEFSSMITNESTDINDGICEAPG